MTSLTAAAIIATTATIIPTPLGGDNVAIAAELSKYPQFSGLTVTDYVIRYHAIVSVPTLILMAVVHSIWQKFMDKRSGSMIEKDVEIGKEEEIKGGALYKFVYTLLPIFPIILLILVYLVKSIAGIEINISVEVATLISFILAIFCECVRTRMRY